MTVILRDVTSSDLNAEDTMEAEEVLHHDVNTAMLDLDHRVEVTKETHMVEEEEGVDKIEDIVEVGTNEIIHHQETDETTCHHQTKEWEEMTGMFF